MLDSGAIRTPGRLYSLALAQDGLLGHHAVRIEYRALRRSRAGTIFPGRRVAALLLFLVLGRVGSWRGIAAAIPGRVGGACRLHVAGAAIEVAVRRASWEGQQRRYDQA